MKKASLLFVIAAATVACNQVKVPKHPTFLEGQDPKPEGSEWVLVENMSDEFEGNTVDEEKWQISGQGWIGRAPGLFMAENVKVSDGSMKITTTILPKAIEKNGLKFTHGGGYVGSRKSMTYGYYECKVRANKTFMSTTFWLINSAQGKKDCDTRTTELDVLEVVGHINNNGAWCARFDEQMNSNTHSRNVPKGCNYPTATQGAKADLGGKAYDDFHVYGVWWKSKSEVWFYLDGKLTEKITPPADFDLDMYLRMVVETYDWNPVPKDGGMNLSEADRTSTYNWVRSWKLKE